MVYIVGGGVFGQVIAAKLRKEGHAVTVFDRGEKEAGSLPSGGHLKPSWLTNIPRPKLDRALETLDSLYGIEHLQCEAGIPPLTKRVEILRVDVEKILAAPVVSANITHVGDGFIEREDGMRLDGTVIVAAGVWCKQLLPRHCKDLTAKKGIAWIFHEGMAVPNIIRPWAPYKQIVRTTHGPNRTWIGDGTALLPNHWTKEAEERIYRRIKPHAPPHYTKLERQRGLRPYLDEGFQRIGDKLWLATGGAKSGTAMAGVAANRIAEALR